MPGIAGVVCDADSLDDPKGIIETIKRVGRLTHVNYQYRQLVSAHAAILRTQTGLLSNTADQPAIDAHRNLYLFLEGEIFNGNELIRRDPVLSEEPSICHVLLAMYNRHGDDFVRHLNGEFNIVIYNRLTRRLVIFSDHLASYPMYFIEDANRLLFASEKKYILPLLTRLPDIDPIGLLQIFAHRYNLDERTFLKRVRRMMPSAIVSYEAAQLNAKRYSDLRFSVPQPVPKTKELVEQWGDVLKEATQSRLENKERVLLSLSGGLDSRAVAASIPRNFRPIYSRTGGLDSSPDVLVAKQIADSLGFNHIRENPAGVPYSAILPKIAWRTECETHFTNAASISGHIQAKKRGDFIAGGWLGDVTSGSHIPPELIFEANRTKFIDRAFNRHIIFDEVWLRKVFTEEFVHEYYPALRSCFHSSFMEIPGQTNIQLYELWDLYQRQRRQTTSSMPIDSYLFEKIRPFYDKRYVEFTLSLPTRLRFGQTLYQCMIFNIGPELRSIPSANNQLPLHNTIAGNLFNKGRTLSARILHRTKQRIGPKREYSLEPQTHDNPASRIRRDPRFREMIEDYLLSRDCNPNIFNVRGIRQLLDQHYARGVDHSYLLGYIGTFFVGLPYFIKRTIDCPVDAEPLSGYPDS